MFTPLPSPSYHHVHRIYRIIGGKNHHSQENGWKPPKKTALITPSRKRAPKTGLAPVEYLEHIWRSVLSLRNAQKRTVRYETFQKVS